MKYWLWIIPIDYEPAQDLWDFCLREDVAAMQYEIGQKNAEINRDLARQIAVGDKVIAYLNQRRVGGVGTVTKPFFEDPTGYQSDYGNAYGQRVGVKWLAAVGGPIDVRKLPIAMKSLESLVLQAKTIHPVDQAAFEQIAEAVQSTHESPIQAELASLIESARMKSAIQLYRSQPEANAKDRLIKQYAYEQKRRLIAPEVLPNLTVDDFDEYILQIGGVVYEGKKYKSWKFWQNYSVDELKAMLENGTVQVVGNCHWGFGAATIRAFFAKLGLDDETIAEQLRDALQVLQDDAKSIEERLEKARSVNGLWSNLTTGILMALTPDEWIVLNDKSNQALRLLGLTGEFKSTVDNYLMYNEFAKQVRDRYGLADLAEVDAVFSRYVDQNGPVNPLAGLSSHMIAHGFHFPISLLTTYFLSLQTKPFAILTGISGTGKTKLAQLFAKWMSPVVETEVTVAFVPVRPDWTDSRGLLGFHNLITGTYSATDFLRLLLRATINLQSDRLRPYFVILDEMNLAKVEYYFADFLSAMESRRLGEGNSIEQECLTLHNQPRCVLAAGNEGIVDPSYYHEKRFTCLVRCEQCPFASLVNEGYHQDGEFEYEEARAAGFAPQHFVPPRLTVPLNAYFSGTVNVDETTYTFSPKVLDRANTIEFGDVRLDTYFSVSSVGGPVAYTASEETIAAFTNHWQFALLPKQVPELRSDLELAPYRDQLVRLNQLLEPFEMHFGYRVADELLLYLWNAQELNDPAFALDVAFDHQIYQKVLPKFHGSQAKLQEPLEALHAFCEEHGYARSAAKIQRMLNMLLKEGFASFA